MAEPFEVAAGLVESLEGDAPLSARLDAMSVKAAELLGLSRFGLQKMMKRLEITDAELAEGGNAEAGNATADSGED